MASGLSVIAFAYGAGGTCIRSGENGVKVPLADEDAFVAAAAALSRDDVVRPAMGKQARAATEAMSWGRVVRDLEERLFEAIRLRRERANASLGTTTQ